MIPTIDLQCYSNNRICNCSWSKITYPVTAEAVVVTAVQYCQKTISNKSIIYSFTSSLCSPVSTEYYPELGLYYDTNRLTQHALLLVWTIGRMTENAKVKTYQTENHREKLLSCVVDALLWQSVLSSSQMHP